VKSGNAVLQEYRVLRFYDGFAAERSLASSTAATGGVFKIVLGSFLQYVGKGALYLEHCSH
jgi:hypothetical protein